MFRDSFAEAMWRYLVLAVVFVNWQQASCGLVGGVKNGQEKSLSINVNGAQIDTVSVSGT